jgi:hypothetical protein
MLPARNTPDDYFPSYTGGSEVGTTLAKRTGMTYVEERKD